MSLGYCLEVFNSEVFKNLIDEIKGYSYPDKSLLPINNDSYSNLSSEIVSVLDLTDLSNLVNGESYNKLYDLGVVKANSALGRGVFGICSYPDLVDYSFRKYKRDEDSEKFKIISVAGGFPSGRNFSNVKLNEVESVMRFGADEVDFVANRNLLLEGEFALFYREIRDALKIVKGFGDDKILKVILEIGEIPSIDLKLKASLLSLFAGVDFLKTSTGKGENYTDLDIVTMATALKFYRNETGNLKGLKASGGIKDIESYINFKMVAESILRYDKPLSGEFFRVGASSLLNYILNEVEDSSDNFVY